jgi:Fe2+ or Zn2+ uptake regulation protein
MKRICNFVTEFLKTNFSFHDLLLIENINASIEGGKKINAKELHLTCPNASSLSTIHRRLNILREKGIIDYSLDYVDGRRTFITKGSNFESTINILQTVIDKNIKTYMDSSADK